jgi:hypothetical protein
MAAPLDHLDEVDIVFPVPGQAEVIVHGGIVKEDEGRRKDKMMSLTEADQGLGMG